MHSRAFEHSDATCAGRACLRAAGGAARALRCAWPTQLPGTHEVRAEERTPTVPYILGVVKTCFAAPQDEGPHADRLVRGAAPGGHAAGAGGAGCAGGGQGAPRRAPRQARARRRHQLHLCCCAAPCTRGAWCPGRPAPRRASLGSRTLRRASPRRASLSAPLRLAVLGKASARVTARARGAVGVRGQPAGERERGQAQGALRGARQRGAPAGPSARLHVPHKRISLVDLTCARAGTSARVNACAPAALAGSRLALYDQWRGTSVCPPLSRPACARWGKRKP